MGVHFADLYVFPAARWAYAHGGDPFLANPSDPWHRIYNYPRLWLSFMVFPPAAIPAVGVGLGATWLAALALWWGRLTWSQAVFASMLLCAPPVVLGLERGNSDLFIFLLVLIAAKLMQRGWRRGSWLALFGAFILKFYPVFAFAVYFRLGWKRAAPWLWATAGIVALYVLWHLGEMQAVMQNNSGPSARDVMVSYGAAEWVVALSASLRQTTGHGLAEGIYGRTARGSMIAAGILVALALVAGSRRRPAGGPGENDRFADGFHAGACIYLATFLLSVSFSYRLIFLLLCVPWLWRTGGTSGHVRIAALVLLGGLFWLNPAWWFPLVIGRELCAWGLLGVLSWLLGESLVQARPPGIRTG